MKLLLTRQQRNPAAVIGSLETDGKLFHCWTLEDPADIFPAGIYTCAITYSPRFKQYLPELLNVPGRTKIRIHSGNDKDDTEGCILTGYEHDEARIWESRAALADLLKLLPERFTLTVRDA